MAMEWLLRHRQPKGTETDRLPFRVSIQRPTRPDSNFNELYYRDSAHTAEIDFLIQSRDKIIPVEVKAGVHVRSRSLAVYKEKYAPPYAIRISAKNFGFENDIKSVPLYAVFCIA